MLALRARVPLQASITAKLSHRLQAYDASSASRTGCIRPCTPSGLCQATLAADVAQAVTELQHQLRARLVEMHASPAGRRPASCFDSECSDQAGSAGAKRDEFSGVNHASARKSQRHCSVILRAITEPWGLYRAWCDRRLWCPLHGSVCALAALGWACRALQKPH